MGMFYMIVDYCNYGHCRVALIKRKLKRIEPFKPIEFSRWAQDQFIDANVALMKYVCYGCGML